MTTSVQAWGHIAEHACLATQAVIRSVGGSWLTLASFRVSSMTMPPNPRNRAVCSSRMTRCMISKRTVCRWLGSEIC